MAIGGDREGEGEGGGTSGPPRSGAMGLGAGGSEPTVGSHRRGPDGESKARDSHRGPPARLSPGAKATWKRSGPRNRVHPSAGGGFWFRSQAS
ncbi:Hypothetical predicted protein [Marmota monax]|uniref:Uncharacterized protein n=1 Tax=Marmota monax TaxID=9995 RepID=A0A5E4B1P1_MARMO|nr:hypothetical protein GHT09_012782 [Marmota monax]VTJ63578.1 Hypothetical predicted protein [Marmota monax]